MANYDEMAAAITELSGGKNVVLFDDIGLPSVYVPVYKTLYSDLIDKQIDDDYKDLPHPAFVVNGAEKDCFYYSKYQNVIINGRAYSLAHRDPAVNLTFDQAREACEAKGPGFHLGTMQEWAAIALWCKKNGKLPHGNNAKGSSYLNAFEKGQFSSSSKNRTFTGSGPATWGHDGTPFGIQDMCGNVWEWNGGMRLVDGEIQIIHDNDAALGAECDQSADSDLWRTMEVDGYITDPGEDGSICYDIVNNYVVISPNGVTNPLETERSFSLKTFQYSTFTLKNLPVALLLYPDGTPKDETTFDYEGVNQYMCNVGERMTACGGYYQGNAAHGIGSVKHSELRSASSGAIGFRSAYVKL